MTLDLDAITDPAPSLTEAADLLREYLPQVMDHVRATQDLTPEDAGKWERADIAQGRRILSTMVHADLDPVLFEQALEVGMRLNSVDQGVCLKWIYQDTSIPNTTDERMYWHTQETRELDKHIHWLTQRIYR